MRKSLKIVKKYTKIKEKSLKMSKNSEFLVLFH